jgi:ribose transport system substrate-binding protein
VSALQQHHVGFVMSDTRATFWALMEQGALECANQLGVRLSAEPTRNAAEQTSMLRRLVQKRIDLLLLAPSDYQGPAELSGMVEQVYASGIPIISCEGGLPDSATLVRCDVRGNLVRAANLVVGHLIEQLGGRGKILHLNAPLSAPRATGFHQALARYPEIVTVEGMTDWTPASSAALTRMALAEHPDLSAIFAHSDAMALAAAQVVEEAGQLGKVLVAGVDADPAALQAIYNNQMSATANVNPWLTGRIAIETAVRVLRGEQVPPVIETPVTLITRDNLMTPVLEGLAVLPKVLSDLADSGGAQRKLHDEVVTAQQRLIRELSTPVIPITDTTLVLPLIGTIDSTRAQQILEKMLTAIALHHAQILIVDITGVAVVDTSVAHHLLQAAQAARLLGATVLLVGITPEVAQTIVQLGVDFSGIITHSTLQSGLEFANSLLHAGNGKYLRR